MAKAILPLIDIVFLTLGSVLACMTQMERVTAMPVSVAEVGSGSAILQQGKFDVLAVTAEGMTLNGKPTGLDRIEQDLSGKKVVLRVDKDLPTGRVWQIMAKLHKAGCEISVEVKEGSAANQSETGRTRDVQE